MVVLVVVAEGEEEEEGSINIEMRGGELALRRSSEGAGGRQAEGGRERDMEKTRRKYLEYMSSGSLYGWGEVLSRYIRARAIPVTS